jgi:NitT/TauT family transport system permease protein
MTTVTAVRGRRMSGRVKEHLTQLALLVVLLLAWQYVPAISALSDRWQLFNRFFISSPVDVVKRIGDLFTGSNGQQSIVSPLLTTLRSALLGVLIGVVVGVVVGLILSASRLAAEIFKPFVTVLSSVPRIAFIPVTVVVFGPTWRSSTFSSALIVFFVVFFNAFEGGRTVTGEMLDNAYLLGAPDAHLMTRIRLPYVLAWTVVALPGAAGYGLVGTVVTEILVGVPGMGRQISLSLDTVDSTTTIALAVLLAVLGIALTALAVFIRSRLLFWWEGGAS